MYRLNVGKTCCDALAGCPTLCFSGITVSSISVRLSTISLWPDMPRGGSSFGSSSKGRVLGTGKREREANGEADGRSLGEGSQVATPSSQVEKEETPPPDEPDEVGWTDICPSSFQTDGSTM